MHTLSLFCNLESNSLFPVRSLAFHRSDDQRFLLLFIRQRPLLHIRVGPYNLFIRNHHAHRLIMSYAVQSFNADNVARLTRRQTSMAANHAVPVLRKEP